MSALIIRGVEDVRNEITRAHARIEGPVAVDADSAREMRWYHGYAELWGALAPLRASYQSHPWFWWTVFVAGYSPFIMRFWH